MAAEPRRGAWEGYGGPIQRELPKLDGIDPTLDSCCQREEEGWRRQSALTRTLRRFDVSAQRERQRKNLVRVTTSADDFDGCRCCYDPDSDGGMYRALMELRGELLLVEDQQQQLQQHDREGHFHHGVDSDEEDEKEEPSERAITAVAAGSAAESEDDDEFDYLLDDDVDDANIMAGPDGTALQQYAEQRRAELEFTVLQREMARQHGFGVHRQMHPLRVLKAALSAPCAVLHLLDPESTASASMDVFFEDTAAPQYAGTKFLRSSGRATLLLNQELVAQHLPRLQPESDLPALVAFRDGVAIAYCPRLQGLVVTTDDNDDDTGYYGGRSNPKNSTRIMPSVVMEWLDRAGVLLSQVPQLEELCRIRPEEEALMDSQYVPKKSAAMSQPDRYDCGREGCMKSFPHEHIGEKTAQQDGLVVPESTILGDELTSA
jgi:hypothetical protein